MRKFIVNFSMLILSVSFVSGLQAQTTTVYLVRHAEKDNSDVNAKDPQLTGMGLQRASDLDKLLADKSVVAVFSTNYKRTMQTAAPLLTRIGKAVTIYEPSETKMLANKILTEYNGKTVLIVGHSNTLIPQIQAFGGHLSITEIKDADYRYLFKLTITGSDVKTEETLFGN